MHPHLRPRDGNKHERVRPQHRRPIALRAGMQEAHQQMTQPPENHLPTRCSSVRIGPCDDGQIHNDMTERSLLG